MNKQQIILSALFSLLVASVLFYTNSSARQKTVYASAGEITGTSTIQGSGMISFNFDDGFESSYINALPIFDRAGFKTTQYVITGRFKTAGYVNEQQVLHMAAEGHEIGAHTRTHPHLSQLTQEQLVNEIAGSRQDLQGIGVTTVTSFAYPYGDENQKTENAVQLAGFSNARSTKYGLNDKNSDPFSLKFESVTAQSKFEKIKSAIDQAISEKKWLILVFHRTNEEGKSMSAHHELIQQIVDYVKQQGVRVVTNSEGVKIMNTIH